MAVVTRVDAERERALEGQLGGLSERFEAAYRQELAAFVDAVANGAPSACTLADARAALLVALAADRSRAERRPVSIEEVTSAKALAG